MEHKSGCMICGEKLIYSEESKNKKCYVCNESKNSNAKCLNGHFICDKCHSLSANDYIEKFCINSDLKDPIEISISIMKNEKIKMHGPEHHFLVPAALLAAYYNLLNDNKNKKNKIKTAKERAEKILGGFCGFYGNCGAAVGTGIFISLITGATPLSKEEWKLSNLMTSVSLRSIAENGGPRCCKRDLFLSMIEAQKFLKENLNINLPINKNIKCEFSSMNKECLFKNCIFFK